MAEAGFYVPYSINFQTDMKTLHRLRIATALIKDSPTWLRDASDREVIEAAIDYCLEQMERR